MDATALQTQLALEAGRRPPQAEETLERLAATVEDLDVVIRQELRGAFAEEFRMLGEASARASQALSGVRRAASLRIALWAAGVTLACSAVPVAVSWTVLPSRAEVAHLRAERAHLEDGVAHLEREGGEVDLGRCGPRRRLCVRVERSGPVYGADADYFIVKGH